MGPVHPRHPGGTSWHTGGDREHDRLPLLPPGRIHYRGSGTVALTIDHAQYVRAFLDAPEPVITVPSVELTKYLARDPHEQDGRLVMERSCRWRALHRSEEHTSELQSLMRISYAVFCLKKKKKHKRH